MYDSGSHSERRCRREAAARASQGVLAHLCVVAQVQLPPAGGRCVLLALRVPL